MVLIMKAYLHYGSIFLFVMAGLILALPTIVHGKVASSRDVMAAALLIITGVHSFRRAKTH